MADAEILYSVAGAVATITLNRPESLNAFTNKMHEDLPRIIDEASRDDRVRVIIVTGAGRCFCAGNDVKETFLSEGHAQKRGNKEVAFKQLLGEHVVPGGHKLLEINKPSIAAVNGAAVGYGCDLALSCSMRIASDKAKFGEVFANVGLVTDEGMMLLPRIVGLAKAYELIMTADIIDAAEAGKIGLVNRVVPHEQLMSAAMELANKIADKAPLAIALGIEGVRRGLKLDWEDYMQYHARAITFCLNSEDHLEGARAFTEKRPPNFKGK
ncbi:MAG: enoyl-CoA hydratase/isomerase family protein [Dehalococcoidales bacterium]|nr:enoyl-CoA hydratase/isomerase family protein [Dehalococcoidales bacterium]